MLERLLKSDTPRLVPMRPRDVDRVLGIIAQTDDDDRDTAEETFRREGLGGMDVLVLRGEVVGVTGHHIDAQTDGAAWLSWTYLDRRSRGQGLGRHMIDTLLARLAGQGVRKIFIDTSDYSEDGRLIYADAHRLYEEFGAEVEMRVPDYFEPGEARIVYALENTHAPDAVTPPEPATGWRVTGLDGVPETEDAAMLVWEATGHGVSGLDTAMEDAREGRARFVAVSLPSDISELASGDLTRQGFQQAGQLKDYHRRGLHQDWWISRPGA